MAALGAAAGTVRCSRCKEVWLARPEDAMSMPAMAGGGYGDGNTDPGAGWDQRLREQADSTPIVESPSIAGDWEDGATPPDAEPDTRGSEGDRPRAAWWRNFVKRPALPRVPVMSIVTLQTALAAMAALTMGLIVWRADVV